MSQANLPVYIKIIVGFLGTAWLMIAILVIYNVVFYDPTVDPFSDDGHQKLVRPNPIDMVFYNAKVALFRRQTTESDEDQNIGWLLNLWDKLRNRVGREVFIEV